MTTTATETARARLAAATRTIGDRILANRDNLSTDDHILVTVTSDELRDDPEAVRLAEVIAKVGRNARVEVKVDNGGNFALSEYGGSAVLRDMCH